MWPKHLIVYDTPTLEEYAAILNRDADNTNLKGYILMGDVARAGIYTSMIKERIDLGDVDIEMLKDKPEMMMFGKARREEKLGGIIR